MGKALIDIYYFNPKLKIANEYKTQKAEHHIIIDIKLAKQRFSIFYFGYNAYNFMRKLWHVRLSLYLVSDDNKF